jgi:hypothetical protein
VALSRYEQFRRAIRDLTILAEADVRVLWRSLGDARDAKVALMDLLPDVVQTYGLASSSLAADFYDDLRAERGVRGRFTAIVPEVPRTGSEGLVAWALGEAKDSSSFQSLVVGGMQRRIANGARNTVTISSVADPGSQGWMRIGAGGCDFCAMLVHRGVVYSESAADFAAHDHCHCEAAPAFDPEQVKAVKSEFTYSARRKLDPVTGERVPISKVERDRVNDWIDANL